jgi:hypothetical protein
VDDEDDDEADEGWSTFAMREPVAVIEAVARQLVSQQRSIAALEEKAAGLPQDSPDPAVRDLLDRVGRAREDWVRSGLPTLTASFQLALEVLDTYGAAGVRIDDPIEAAVWNNKFFVWRDTYCRDRPSASR